MGGGGGFESFEDKLKGQQAEDNFERRVLMTHTDQVTAYNARNLQLPPSNPNRKRHRGAEIGLTDLARRTLHRPTGN